MGFPPIDFGKGNNMLPLPEVSKPPNGGLDHDFVISKIKTLFQQKEKNPEDSGDVKLNLIATYTLAKTLKGCEISVADWGEQGITFVDRKGVKVVMQLKPEFYGDGYLQVKCIIEELVPALELKQQARAHLHGYEDKYPYTTDCYPESVELPAHLYKVPVELNKSQKACDLMRRMLDR